MGSRQQLARRLLSVTNLIIVATRLVTINEQKLCHRKIRKKWMISDKQLTKNI